MDEVNLLGVRVDRITLDQAVEKVSQWVEGSKRRYVVTPNVEFIMAARSDPEFKKILNEADLAIPDSSRFGWALAVKAEKAYIKKLLLWPLFPLSGLFFKGFPVTTGTDLMEQLCRESVVKGFRIGLLGGPNGVALKLKECLEKKYPGIKIVFADSGGKVDQEGFMEGEFSLSIPSVDILFIAFGQVKQEKWVVKNMNKVDAKVFMGVGGAFDYLSGSITRAPGLMRRLGLEWLFRLFMQPWRIKRFVSLARFVFLIF